MLDDLGLKEVFIVENKVYIVFHEPFEEMGFSENDLQELLSLIQDKHNDI